MSTDFANLLIWPLDYPGKPQCPDSSPIHLEKMGTPCLKQWFLSSECRIKSKPLSAGACTLQNLSRSGFLPFAVSPASLLTFLPPQWISTGSSVPHLRVCVSVPPSPRMAFRGWFFLALKISFQVLLFQRGLTQLWATVTCLPLPVLCASFSATLFLSPCSQ